MECFKSHKLNFLLSILMFLSSSILHSHSLAPPGTIERVTKQQLLASLPPLHHETIPAGSSQFFLASPSRKYSVYLVRRETSLGAGGFGSDFCYLQVQESGVSVWESECTPVSNANTCTLLFSEAGLEIFDGSNSAWDNDVDGENLEALVLMDSGDMQIRDRDGELVWRASDNPIINQNCGSIGAPGMAPAHPPFASPLHDGRGPFGQPIASHTQQPLPQLGAYQPQSGAFPAHQVQEVQQQHGSPIEEQPAQAPVASLEEEQQPQAPTASPEEEQQPQAPTASHEEEQQPQPPAASPEEEKQPQVEPKPLTSPEEQQQSQANMASHEEGHQQQPPAASPEEGLDQTLSPRNHPIGVTNQPISPLNHPTGATNHPFSSFNQPIPVEVTHQQPLIDNTPFDSGSSIEKPFKLGVSLVFLVTLMAITGTLF